MNTELGKAVQEAETKLRNAMLDSDLNALSALLADDLVFTNHLGQLLTKRDDLSAHESGRLDIESINISENSIKILGNTAVVTARVQICGTYDGNPTNGDFRFTRIWANQDNSLQVKAAHSCTVT
ncbi:nuclear transport factor 2 family protein [Microbulbifer sp. MLAF003]|uniref:nuclear transport factor 2 family protein n=1 Tax=Microbulbifer TaxID=48073 RepID=UPI00035F6A29|nr:MULTISPECIES: nuclear transport factor 2 family protein [Microbulbifer]WHI50187.1 nuclear transport factor 2 family protein [Microbulbifer sp. MLAF003]